MAVSRRDFLKASGLFALQSTRAGRARGHRQRHPLAAEPDPRARGRLDRVSPTCSGAAAGRFDGHPSAWLAGVMRWGRSNLLKGR